MNSKNVSSPTQGHALSLLELVRHVGTVEVERPHQVFCNRDIDFRRIEAIGFDMDYTLAVYKQEAMDKLSVELTLERLIAHRNYPKEIKTSITPKPYFAIRGLVVDTQRGHILKLDSHRHVGKAYHGFRALTPEELEVYAHKVIRFHGGRYVLIDTLYALPEAFLYAALIDYFEQRSGLGALSYRDVHQDIRFCIDLAHRDDSFAHAIMADTQKYVERTPYLALALHRFRSSGKRLFVITNSFPKYTEHMMTYLLDGVLPEYESWRQYFDVIVAGSKKPSFFSERAPFLVVDDKTLEAGEPEEGLLRRGVIYQGGNFKDLVERTDWPVGQTLYIGDHIYGDILRSRRTGGWRTAMIVQEMERELIQYNTLQEELTHIKRLEDEVARLTQELSYDQWLDHHLHELIDKVASEQAQDSEEILALARGQLRHARDRMQRRRKDLLLELISIESALEGKFNPYWGLIFKMNNKNSVLGEQVEDYACLYTSLVTNFVNYSPMHYFRAPRQPMPHERG